MDLETASAIESLREGVARVEAGLQKQGDEIRVVRVLTEDVRDDVRIVAEGLAGQSQQLAAQSQQLSALTARFDRWLFETGKA